MGRRGTLTSALAGLLEQDSKLNELREKREEQRARALQKRRERQKRRKLDTFYYFTSSSESEYTSSDEEEETNGAPFTYSTNNRRKASFNVPRPKKWKIPNHLSPNETAIIFWKTGFEIKLQQRIKKQIDKRLRMMQRRGRKSIASKLSLTETKKEEKDVQNDTVTSTTTTTAAISTPTLTPILTPTPTPTASTTRAERVRKSIPLGENKVLFTHAKFKKVKIMHEKQPPNNNNTEPSQHSSLDQPVIIKTLEENHKTNSSDVTKPTCKSIATT